MTRLALPSVLALLLACSAQAGLEPKETYRSIIDAKPFGELAANANTNTGALAEQQKQKEELAKKFRMCGITDMPDGTRKIAFLDETNGTVATYLLSVGETQNGFTLISADYEREFATISKDGVEFTLGLGKGLIDKPAEADAVPLPAIAPEPVALALEPTPAAENGVRPSFRKRLLHRQARLKAAEEEKEQKRVAEASQKEAVARRVQIERIKQGLAPTQPIVLTAEEDAELEAAGAFAAPAVETPSTPAHEQGNAPAHPEGQKAQPQEGE